jgi:hypothetical protein
MVTWLLDIRRCASLGARARSQMQVWRNDVPQLREIVGVREHRTQTCANRLHHGARLSLRQRCGDILNDFIQQICGFTLLVIA